MEGFFIFLVGGVGGRTGSEEYFGGETICIILVSVDNVAPQQGHVINVQESDESSSGYSADRLIGILFSREGESIIL